jgi:hypothetical protein
MNVKKLRGFVENLPVQTWIFLDAIVILGVICCVGLIFGVPGLIVLCILAVYSLLWGD